MANLKKVLGWFNNEAKPAPPDPPATSEETPTEEPAIELFPEEASGEKRSMARRPLEVPATLVTGSFTAPDPITVRDISPRGVYFFAPYKLAAGQVVEIRLTEPDSGEHVCYHGNVVRAENAGENQFGIAVRITRREILAK